MVTTVPLLEIFPRLRWFKRISQRFVVACWNFTIGFLKDIFAMAASHLIICILSFHLQQLVLWEAIWKENKLAVFGNLGFPPKCETQFCPTLYSICSIYTCMQYIYKCIWLRIQNHRLCIYLANKSLFDYLYFLWKTGLNWVIHFVTEWDPLRQSLAIRTTLGDPCRIKDNLWVKRDSDGQCIHGWYELICYKQWYWCSLKWGSVVQWTGMNWNALGRHAMYVCM